MSPLLAIRTSSKQLGIAGEGVFETIPIEEDYTVGDMKLWLKFHKGKDPVEYDLVGPKGKWKMGAGSEVLFDEQVISDFMGERFENKWLMQLSLCASAISEHTRASHCLATCRQPAQPLCAPTRAQYGIYRRCCHSHLDYFCLQSQRARTRRPTSGSPPLRPSRSGYHRRRRR